MNHAPPVPFDVRLMNFTAGVMFAGCVALLLAAGGWWVLRNPALAIGSIAVEGDLAHNTEQTLRESVAGRLPGSFLTLDLPAARAVFESTPWVRKASVRREFPDHLRVRLQEHVPQAYWGAQADTTMLNSFGEIFDAPNGDIDVDMPRLFGPDAQAAAEVLSMYRVLQPVFRPLGMEVDALDLSNRGGWRATLESGATVELGSGSEAEVEARARRFVRTLDQVVAQHGRKADALESADLRHGSGYALRLRGVTTLDPNAPPAPARPAARPPARPAASAAPAARR
ncbi:MAG: cell division protein FtsQ/DivIB [Xylophilus ampelinus]